MGDTQRDRHVVADDGLDVDLDDPVNPDHDLNAGRLAWWLALPGLEGGATWYDLMGRTPGTLTSMGNGSNGWRNPTRPGGRGEVLCDGTAGYVQGPAPARTYPLALACWSRLASTAIATGQDRILVSLAQKGALEEFWTGYYSPDGVAVQLRVLVQGGGAAASQVGPITLDTNWHRILAVFPSAVSSGFLAYLDGLPFSLPTNSPATVNPAAVDTLFAGALIYNATNFYGGFDGRLDDVTAWAGNPLLISNPAAFAAADFDLSSRGYPGVLNRH